jgi:hypothetical protein
MGLQLEQYIPLPQAAKRLKISVASLQGLIDSGNIRAVKLNGTVAVAESELGQIIAITRDQFKHLRGHPITIAMASERYGINHVTIRGWIEREYIHVIKEGYGTEIDESDIAYCAAVYKIHGGGRGKRLFDDNGLPYQSSRTEWATYQRQRRKKKKGPLTAK